MTGELWRDGACSEGLRAGIERMWRKDGRLWTESAFRAGRRLTRRWFGPSLTPRAAVIISALAGLAWAMTTPTVDQLAGHPASAGRLLSHLVLGGTGLGLVIGLMLWRSHGAASLTIPSKRAQNLLMKFQKGTKLAQHKPPVRIGDWWLCEPGGAKSSPREMVWIKFNERDVTIVALPRYIDEVRRITT